MVSAISNIYNSILKNAQLKITIVIFTIAVIGLSVVGHYGVSSDEPMGIKMVHWNVLLLTKGQPIPNPVIKYYGTAFNGTAELVYQGKEWLEQKFLPNSPKEKGFLDGSLDYTRIYKRTKVKHVLNFLVSLIAYVAVSGIVGILVGWQYAWLGAVTLAMFPRFWGHSFFNPKDIPFAATLTLGTFLGACLIDYYHKITERKQRLGWNRATLYSLLYGWLAGVISGTRLAGFIILLFFMIAHLISSLGRKNIIQDFLSFWSLYGCILISWMITVVILFPSSWYDPGGQSSLANPIAWFFDGVTTLAKFETWQGTNFFDGQYIPAKSVPWNYVPQWLLIAVPEILLILFGIGLIGIILNYLKFTRIQKACSILVLLQIFFIPTAAIIKHSIIYDEIRHFLFIIPGIAAIAASATIWIYQKITQKTVKLFAIALLITLASSIIFDMITLHPYEHVFFNRLSGGLAKAHERYDTDYWGLSMREGTEWINKQSAGNQTNVLSSQELFASKFYAAPNVAVALYKSYLQTNEGEKPIALPKPFYYIAKPRWDYQRQLPECPIVYEVKRQGVPLTIVKKCD